ncbi:CpaF family protein [Streptomyces sp. NPDC059900]|uniref:CpaF family protein n=1 Tax=Streptomyces sp. NPDC059900 TaxID=3155816 RepID=UPI003D089F4F
MSGPTSWNPAPPGTAAGAPLPHTRTPRPDPRAAVSRPPDRPDAGPAPAGSGAGEPLKEQLHRELSQRLSERLHSHQAPGPAPGQARWTGSGQRAAAETLLAEAAEEHARHQLTRGEPMLPPEAEQQVITAVLNEVCGPDAGLEPLLRDPDVETININGDCVFVRYVDGRRAQLPSVAASDAELVQLIRGLAARSGAPERRFDRGSPSVSFQLPTGERVVAVMAVSARPSVSIRRRHPRVSLAELRRLGTIDRSLEAFLGAAVRARKNMLVTGGTARGKTTLLRALAAEIPPAERLITIEEVFELGLDGDPQAHPDVVALQAREAHLDGQKAVSQSDLVRWALQMAPDRVIVGEVRGPEVILMCNAMSRGSDGSMATVNTSTSRGAFTRFAAYAVQGAERMTPEATNLLVASALDFVVHLEWSRDEPAQRVVSSVREVIGADGRQIISNEVYRPGPALRAEPGVPLRSQTLGALTAEGLETGRGGLGWPL